MQTFLDVIILFLKQSHSVTEAPKKEITHGRKQEKNLRLFAFLIPQKTAQLTINNLLTNGRLD